MDLWGDSPMWACEILVALQVMGGDLVGFTFRIWGLYKLAYFLPW